MCDHEECKQKQKQWLRGTKDLEGKEQDLKNLLNSHELAWSLHSEIREDQRRIPARQSTEAFREGFCLHFSIYHDPKHGLTQKWLWMGYAKVGTGLYRPLHLPILYNVTTGLLQVGTVYDPSSKPELWNEDFTIRQCWIMP